MSYEIGNLIGTLLALGFVILVVMSIVNAIRGKNKDVKSFKITKK